jgi:hypothetical protein
MNEDREMRLQDLLEEYDFSGDTGESKETCPEADIRYNSGSEGNKVNQTSTDEGETTMNEITVDESQPPIPVSLDEFTEFTSPTPEGVRSVLPTPTPDFAEPVEAVAPSIASSALIVNLSRSVPDLVKNDPEAAKALARIKNADVGAVTARKSLIDSPALKDLQRLSREIYQWHIKNTVPWGDLGQRLVANAALIDYKNTMNKFEIQFEALANKVVFEYPACCGRAQNRLGDLFDPALFPSVEELRRKMSLRVTYEPIADPSNFIVQIGDQAAEEMKRQYNEVLSNRMEGISNYIYEKLREPLTNLVKRIDYEADDAPTGFRNTIVDNVMQIVELMGTCNFNNDPKIDRLKRELRNALKGVTPDALREDSGLRRHTKQEVQKIIDQLPSLGF